MRIQSGRFLSFLGKSRAPPKRLGRKFDDVNPGMTCLVQHEHNEGTLSSRHRPRIYLFEKQKNMPDRCVVFGCRNENGYDCKARGISLHKIPFFGDERPVAKRRRKLWVDFVRTKRAKWDPTKHSAICSQHFKSDDFASPTVSLPGFGGHMKAVLKRDDIGISAIPSVQPVITDQREEQVCEYSRPRPKKSTSTREHWRVIRF